MRSRRVYCGSLLWGLALISGLLTACLPLSASGKPPSAPGPPPQAPGMVTAREAYLLAERVGKDWRADAVLASATAAWYRPAPEELLQGKTTWAFYFSSPSLPSTPKATLFIVAVEGESATGVRETQSQLPFSPTRYSEWRVDSPHALATFLEKGGRDFLAQHRGADVHVRLSTPQENISPVWMISALDSRSRASLVVQMDAKTGAPLAPP